MNLIKRLFSWIFSLFATSAPVSVPEVSVPPTPDETGGTTVSETGKKYALLVGINKYMVPNADLNGCVNDTESVWNVLTTKFGFDPDNIRVLNDERATHEGILLRLEWLVSQAEAGDQLVFHYSGHGSQVRDRNGDESLIDSLDEILCPTDLDWDNPLTDDTLATYFKRVPEGATLTFICDACHSGSMDRGLTPPTLNPHMRLDRYLQPPFDIAARSKGRDLPRNNIGEKSVQDRGTGNVHVIKQNHVLISGCRDDQTSADAHIDGKYQGALTATLVKVICEHLDYDWKHIHELVVKDLSEGGYTQVPQLTGAEILLDHVAFGGSL